MGVVPGGCSAGEPKTPPLGHRRGKDHRGRGGGVPSRMAHGAMRWRIGNFYYSFLREQYVHAVFRECGVHLRQHPLADALF